MGPWERAKAVAVIALLLGLLVAYKVLYLGTRPEIYGRRGGPWANLPHVQAIRGLVLLGGVIAWFIWFSVKNLKRTK
jgi:hypothetical protein